MQLLLVEDDEDLREETAEALEDAGFSVIQASSVAEFLTQFSDADPDAYILDMSLPDGTGIDIARHIRNRGRAPILFLSGKNDEVDRIIGFEIGADDFIQKPCSTRELIARTKAAIRRYQVAGNQNASEVTAGTRFQFEGFELDVAAMELRDPQAQNVELTATEFRLLEIFVQNSGEVLERDFLLDKLRGENWAGYDRTIDGLVSKLRRKVSRPDRPLGFFKTIRGLGYKFIASVAEVASRKA